MVMRAQDVGSQLTRVEQADGAWSLPAARLAADPHEWCLRYEREVARAEAAEARADEWRQAEIVARSQVCSLKALFEANRNKLIEARQETEAIRRTAKDALSLQAEVQRLTKLLAATHVEPRKRCTMVSLRMQVGDLREENARLRSQLRKALRRSRRPQGTPKTLSRANARLRKSLQVSQKRTAALETALAEVGASRAVLSKSLYGRRSEQQAKPHSTRRRGRRWRNDLKCTRRQPRRACVAAAARRM
jgi:myosin heavy subunit